jgi:hypothetical protein
MNIHTERSIILDETERQLIRFALLPWRILFNIPENRSPQIGDKMENAMLRMTKEEVKRAVNRVGNIDEQLPLAAFKTLRLILSELHDVCLKQTLVELFTNGKAYPDDSIAHIKALCEIRTDMARQCADAIDIALRAEAKLGGAQ